MVDQWSVGAIERTASQRAMKMSATQGASTTQRATSDVTAGDAIRRHNCVSCCRSTSDSIHERAPVGRTTVADTM
eukprot:1126105-Prymnesium_polylepis.1